METREPSESNGRERPLRMAARPSAEDLAQRFERERRRVLEQREDDLSNTLAPYRVGSVPYLNAVPLTRGLEDQIAFLPPSELAERLRAGALDAGLVSVTEVLLHDGYDVLDEVAVGSFGEVKSVFLAHRRPLEEVSEVHCDPASLTSVNLLRVLLAERGIRPRFVPLSSYEAASSCENVLLIGDPALRFLRGQPEHRIWDLGAAWHESTQLPFVYAVWALRRGHHDERLRRQLREAKSFGMETLDSIIRQREDFDEPFRRDYLTWHIQYHLGIDEKRGLARFMELMTRHGLGPVLAPRFVS